MDKKISHGSMFSLHIEMYRKGTKIGDGTGFIYFHAPSDGHFLVTNYHVATARVPKDPSSLLPGFPDSPDELVWAMLEESASGVVPRRGGISLVGEDLTWLEHPERNRGVDLVAIPFDPPSSARIYSQDKLGLVEDIEVGVGDDLFIVGFPYGISTADILPIWKRGTVASEPLVKPEGLPCFYIDATTTPGMSGSPVFATEKRDLVNMTAAERAIYEKAIAGDTAALKQLNPEKLMGAKRTRCLQLVGVYSGRLMSGTRDPSIGIVWTAEALSSLFARPVVAEHPFPPT